VNDDRPLSEYAAVHLFPGFPVLAFVAFTVEVVGGAALLLGGASGYHGAKP
jgi:uncharacterized membrane protein YphA (DoxX/SURF4 family)